MVRVLAINNEVLSEPDVSYPDTEAIGQAYIRDVLCLDGRFIQTSFNGNFRVRYAGIGYVYDADRDAFLPPKLYPSWILDETSLTWKPPHPDPHDGSGVWDEESQSWSASD